MLVAPVGAPGPGRGEKTVAHATARVGMVDDASDG